MENKYNKVYDFTNENVSCLKYLYHFDNSKVLSVVGSGDQYFASILNGAKQVDLFDINPTSYLYLLLKFYSIRELTYEEFYDFLVLKNLNNLTVYSKLESVLPLEVLKYYKFLMMYTNKTKQIYFRKDGINLLSKKNQKYYFETDYSVIPYFEKQNYYELQEKLKKLEMPKFFQCDVLTLKSMISDNYDIMLMSNIYDHLSLHVFEYTKLLNEFGSPEIQAFYDWYGFRLNEFICEYYSVTKVKPSSPSQFNRHENFVFSLKNKNK